MHPICPQRYFLMVFEKYSIDINAQLGFPIDIKHSHNTAINNDTLFSFITHYLVVALPKLTGGVKRCAHY
jgi:hypothetical protein